GKHLSSLTERGQPECSVPVHANRCSAGNQRDALFWGDDFIVLPTFMRANGALFLEHVMPIL
ncbi:hypothetical protein, partial [Rhizobium rhizogenes]|uniref:hypothetical protein n=1 Tax=Rhizobium rhizogenes TaxID=359 RepID=UPI001AEDAD8B